MTVKYLQKTARSDPNPERKLQTFMISLVSWDNEPPSWAPRNFGGDRPVYSGLSTETIPIAMGNPEIQRLIWGQMWDFQAMLLYRCSKNRMLFDHDSISPLFHPKLDQSLSKFLATWNIPGPWFHLHQPTCS